VILSFNLKINLSTFLLQLVIIKKLLPRHRSST